MRKQQPLQRLRFRDGQPVLEEADEPTQVTVDNRHSVRKDCPPLRVDPGQQMAGTAGRRVVLLLGQPAAEGLVQGVKGLALLARCGLHGAVHNVLQGLDRVPLEDRVDVLESIAALGPATMFEIFSHPHPVTQSVLPKGITK